MPLPAGQTPLHAAAGTPASESATSFLQRGEAAWQDYLRTGRAVPAEEVFARLKDLLDAKPVALTARLTPG